MRQKIVRYALLIASAAGMLTAMYVILSIRLGTWFLVTGTLKQLHVYGSDLEFRIPLHYMLTVTSDTGLVWQTIDVTDVKPGEKARFYPSAGDSSPIIVENAWFSLSHVPSESEDNTEFGYHVLQTSGPTLVNWSYTDFAPNVYNPIRLSGTGGSYLVFWTCDATLLRGAVDTTVMASPAGFRLLAATPRDSTPIFLGLASGEMEFLGDWGASFHAENRAPVGVSPLALCFNSLCPIDSICMWVGENGLQATLMTEAKHWSFAFEPHEKITFRNVRDCNMYSFLYDSISASVEFGGTSECILRGPIDLSARLYDRIPPFIVAYITAAVVTIERLFAFVRHTRKK